MKRLHRRILPILICIPLALAACSNDPEPTGSEPGAGRGRYVEEEITFPDQLGDILGIDQLDDGSLYLLGIRVLEPRPTGFRGEYAAWSSGDGGLTWREEGYPWLDELNDDDNAGPEDGISINSATFASPDLVYLLLEKTLPMEPMEEAPEEGYEDFYTNPFTREICRADRTGMEPIPSGSWEEFRPQTIKAMGDSLVLNQYEAAAVIDPTTGRERYTLEIRNDLVWGSYTLLGDSLLLVQPTAIQAYDLDSGVLSTEYSYISAEKSENMVSYSSNPDWITALAPSPDGEALYYCNATGLYRMLPSGDITEKIMDGDLTSLALPTIQIHYLFPSEDGRFLVIGRQGYADYKLFRYTFDETVASVPSQEIKVYSLSENLTIRQAMGLYQQHNLEVKVNYQVGREAGSGLSFDDALRAFHTELLAGSGPDVLVLDDLPLQSYREKGILDDLSPLVRDAIAAGAVYQNIVETYREDGKLYAVPARFSVPMVHGTGIESVQDLRSMAAWLEDKPADINTPADFMIQRFFPIVSQGWFQADGTLDEAALESDLTDLLAIASPAWNLEGYVYNEESSLLFGATQMKGKAASLSFGYLQNLTGLSGPYSLVEETGEGTLQFFGTDGDRVGVYLPRCVLGVRADSSKAALARSFVDFVLSEEIQGYDFEDGLPVHIAAMEKTARFGEDPQRMTVGGGYDDPDTGENVFVLLTCSMPDEAVTREWIQRFATLDTPLAGDAVTQQLVIDETAGYFSGTASLEDTLASLKSKLSIRGME